jgi:serine/threonine protein kinase
MDFDDSSSSGSARSDTSPVQPTEDPRPRAAKTSGFALEGEFGPSRAVHSESSESDDPLDSPEHRLFTEDAADPIGENATIPEPDDDTAEVEGLIGLGRIISSAVHSSVVLANDGGNAVCVKLTVVPRSEDDVAGSYRQQMDSLHQRLSTTERIAQAPPLLLPHRLIQLDGAIASVMPHVSGGSLSDVLAFASPLSVPQIAAIASRLCVAVSAMHSCGVVHGNLKLSNVLLSPTGEIISVDPLVSGSIPFTQAEIALTPKMASWISDITREALDPSGTADTTSSPLSSIAAVSSPVDQIELHDAIYAAARASPFVSSESDDWFSIATIIAELCAGVPQWHGRSVFDVAEEVLSSSWRPRIDGLGDRHPLSAVVEQFCEDGPTAMIAIRELSASLDVDEQSVIEEIADATARAMKLYLDDDHLPQGRTWALGSLKSQVFSTRRFPRPYFGETSPSSIQISPKGIDGHDIRACNAVLWNQNGRNVFFEGVATSTVAVLGHGGVAVLRDVVDSEIVLGPFFAVLVSGCQNSVIRCAAHTVRLENCNGVSLAAVTSLPIEVDQSCGDDNDLSAYNVSYPGVTRDFSHVHMPLMSRFSDGLGGTAPPTYWTEANLQPLTATGHEAPFLLPCSQLSLKAHGTNIVLLPGDAPGRLVRIDGGQTGEPSVVVVLECCEEVSISCLNHATIVVAGAQRLILDRLVGCDVYALCGEVALTHCADLRLSIQTMEGIVSASCESLAVAPWRLECCGLRAIAEQLGIDKYQEDPESVVGYPQPCDTFAPPTLRIPFGPGPEGEVLAGAVVGDSTITLGEVCQCGMSTIAALTYPSKFFGRHDPSLFPSGSTEASERCLVIEGVRGGVIHVADSIAEVLVKDCGAQLEIAVAACGVLTIEHSDNITIHAAAAEVTIRDSHFVTAALYSPSAPSVSSSSCVQLCTLNMAVPDWEMLLGEVGLDLEVPNAVANFVADAPEEHEVPLVIVGPPLEALILSSSADPSEPFLAPIEDAVAEHEAMNHVGLASLLQQHAHTCYEARTRKSTDESSVSDATLGSFDASPIAQHQSATSDTARSSLREISPIGGVDRADSTESDARNAWDSQHTASPQHHFDSDTSTDSSSSSSAKSPARVEALGSMVPPDDIDTESDSDSSSAGDSGAEDAESSDPTSLDDTPPLDAPEEKSLRPEPLRILTPNTDDDGELPSDSVPVGDDGWDAVAASIAQVQQRDVGSSGPRSPPRSLSPLQLPRNLHRRATAAEPQNRSCSADASASKLPIVKRDDVEHVLARLNAGPGRLVRKGRKAPTDALEQKCGEILRKAALIEALVNARNSHRRRLPTVSEL